jgi:hypothetical protein
MVLPLASYLKAWQPAASHCASVSALAFKNSVSQAMMAMVMPPVLMPCPPNIRLLTHSPTLPSKSQQ